MAVPHAPNLASRESQMNDILVDIKDAMRILRQLAVPARHIHTIHRFVHVMDAVDKLHQPWPNRRECKECCLPWPCLTSKILNPKEANDE